MKLYMILLGCTPFGRHIEQHDLFFAVGESLKDVVPDILEFWPENKLHIDAWREVTEVDGYSVEVVERAGLLEKESLGLFFLNLGGYRRNEFDEQHYRMLLVGGDKGEVIRRAKDTAFFKHHTFEGAPSHIDDKYGVDVDDLFEIVEVLPQRIKEKFAIVLKPLVIGVRLAETDGKHLAETDEVHLGYLPLSKL